MLYYIFLIISILILYVCVKNFEFWPNVIIYVILQIIGGLIVGMSVPFFILLIKSFIWGLLYVKIYKKIVELTDSLIYSVIIMGIIEFVGLSLIASILNFIF